MLVQVSHKEKNASEGALFTISEIEFALLHTFTSIFTYSHLIWSNGHRKAKNFTSTNMLILDFDGTKSMEEMKSLFSNTKNVLIVTSKSHQKSNKVNNDGSLGKAIAYADFYHVIIGLELPITDLDTYLTVIRNLINKFGADTSCSDGARQFYCNPTQEHWYS